MPSALSTKTNLLQHPKEYAVQLRSQCLHYLVQNNLSNREVNCHAPEQNLSSQQDSSQLFSIKMRKWDEFISKCNKVILSVPAGEEGGNSTKSRNLWKSFSRLSKVPKAIPQPFKAAMHFWLSMCYIYDITKFNNSKSNFTELSQPYITTRRCSNC